MNILNRHNRAAGAARGRRQGLFPPPAAKGKFFPKRSKGDNAFACGLFRWSLPPITTPNPLSPRRNFRQKRILVILVSFDDRP